MDNHRMKENQSPSFVFSNFVPEDIGIPSNSSEKKRNGASDPRFKKIIDTDLQNLSASESGKSVSRGPKTSSTKGKSELTRTQNSTEKFLTFLKLSEDYPMFKSPNSKFLVDQKEQDLSAEVTKDTGLLLPDEQLTSNITKEFSHNGIQNIVTNESLDETAKTKNNCATDLKRSVSDCTLQTPEKENESDEHIRLFSSSTKLLNSENWMKPRKGFPEKRRSVVTVIGQTQMKSFNEILSEIQQRRKLAKELDKHALCEALMSSVENHSKFKNVVTKVDLLLPDGKVIYSTEKVYSRKNNTPENSLYSNNSTEILYSGDKRRKCETIPAKDLSAVQLGKKKCKRPPKKSIPLINERSRIKDNLRNMVEEVTPRFFWLMLLVLVIGLGFSFIFYILDTPQTYYILQIFRPKATPWYEKLLLI